MNFSTRNAIFVTGVLMTFVIVFRAAFITENIFLGLDFSQVWVAGRLADMGRLPEILQAAEFKAATQEMLTWYLPEPIWSYPPPTLLFAMPLGLLPYVVSVWLWNGIQAVAVGLTVVLVTRGRVSTAQAVLIAVTSPALMVSCLHGQFSALIGSVLIASVFSLGPRPVMAGVFVGLIILKPQFGLLPALVFFLNREWKTIMAAGAVVLAACGAITGIVGWRIWPDYWNYTLPAQAVAMRDLDTYGIGAHSVLDCLLLMGVPYLAGFLTQAFASLVAVAASVLVFRRSDDVGERAFVLTIASVLVLPYANLYEQALPALGALALLNSRKALPQWMLASAYFLWLSPAIELVLAHQGIPKIAPLGEIALLLAMIARWRNAPNAVACSAPALATIQSVPANH